MKTRLLKTVVSEYRLDQNKKTTKIGKDGEIGCFLYKLCGRYHFFVMGVILFHKLEKNVEMKGILYSKNNNYTISLLLWRLQEIRFRKINKQHSKTK